MVTTRRGGGNGMFHGWRILGVTLASQAVQAGLLIYGFGVIILPFAAEFGVPRQTLMLGSTLLSLTTNIISPLGGAAIDRGWTRNLMTFGAVMLALAFLALSRVNAMWQVLAVFALMLPFSNLLLGQLTSSALMTRWFTRLRGRALGLSAVGTSIGGLLVPPIVAQLSVTLGWRNAYAIVGLGALALLIIPIRAWTSSACAPSSARNTSRSWRPWASGRSCARNGSRARAKASPRRSGTWTPSSSGSHT